jgi:uncharacterized protein YxeA
MKNFIIGIVAVIVLVFTVRAFASTVTTTDGQNFTVTNDGGFSWAMTNAQIMTKITQYNQQIAGDQASVQQAEANLGTDQESLIVWNGVEQMAVNAAITVNAT